ncbi:DUF1467 family protein [Pelagibacterium sp. H642]|uniref:DUF1467 family protein n=1 Tax=Pelagibacterium sp. H642 TaxID=1881069 RepID=UPI0028161584|nr:DUF1467 family protein [Pelagibacterium sp. H642]WMT90653.1 DUF1467 family protein [Pelagibacterium sp. H642]
MQPFTYVAIYFIVWWTVLFAVLPFGVRGQHEDGEFVQGTEPGAPVKAHLWQKVLATTVISAVVTVLLFWVLSNPALQEYWS